ncbi:MAG: TolC family protein [Polyangia bacterium]
MERGARRSGCLAIGILCLLGSPPGSSSGLLGGARAAGPAAAPSPTAPPELPAPDLVLTLEQALEQFRAQGFDLLLADAAVESARGDEQAAGAVPNPLITASVLKVVGLPEGLTTPDPGPQGVGVSALLTDGAMSEIVSGKRWLRKRSAQAALAAARHQRADAQRLLELQLRQQYLEVAQLQLSYEFGREVVQSAAQTAELNRLRLKAGAISEAELAKAETAMLEAEQRLDEVAQRLRLAQLDLLVLVGVRGPAPQLRVDSSLMEQPVPRQQLALGRDELQRLALANRPDLLAADQETRRADFTLRLMRRLNVPDFQLQVGYTQQGSGPAAVQPPTLSFGLGLSLPVFYQRQGERTRAAAELRTQQLLLSRLQTRVLAEVDAAYTTWLTSQRLLLRMEGQQLERARRARDLAQIQYQKGAASLLEYLDAQRTYINTRFSYLQQRMGYWVAVFQLEQAVATELFSGKK